MKIAILGTAFSANKAPFDDASWEIWACNNVPPKRWDRWFQLHDDANIDSVAGHREWLAEQTKPVYIQKTDPSIPNGIAYPLPEMVAKYGSWFFTSSISYMLALAIEEVPEEIGVYGVDMADATEYAHQKPGCRFFIQVAKMQGIKVTIPPEAEVAVPGRLYGFDGPSWIQQKASARKTELLARIDQNDARRQTMMAEKLMLRGARDITVPKEAIDHRLAELETAIIQCERDALVLDGGRQDIEHVLLNWCGET